MNSPLKEFLPFTFDKVSPRDLAQKLQNNLNLDPPAKALTPGQLRSLAERKFLERVLGELTNK